MYNNFDLSCVEAPEKTFNDFPVPACDLRKVGGLMGSNPEKPTE